MGSCYISADEAINYSSDFLELAKQFYNPTVWADLMNIANSYMVIGSALMNNCMVYQFLNQFTGGITTVAPQIFARLAGGAINEIPAVLKAVKKSKTCYKASVHAA